MKICFIGIADRNDVSGTLCCEKGLKALAVNCLGKHEVSAEDIDEAETVPLKKLK